MNSKVSLDWKSIVALGTTACGFVLVLKMGPEAAERVLISAIDALKGAGAAYLAKQP